MSTNILTPTNGKTRIKNNPRCPSCTSDNVKLKDSRSDGNGLTGRLYHCERCTRDFSTLVREEIEPHVKGQHTTYSLLHSQQVQDFRKRVSKRR